MSSGNTNSNRPGRHDHAAQNQPVPAVPPADRPSTPDAALLETELDAQATEIAELQKKLLEAEQSWLRAQADLDNYRKRVRRDQAEERRYAQLPIIEDLLPIVDNFQRALGAMQGAPTDVQMGVQMVAQQLEQVLAKHDCQPINAVGAMFDPMCHEAIGQEPSADHPPQTILRVEQTGYRLHDRVIRPAKVVVASGNAATN